MPIIKYTTEKDKKEAHLRQVKDYRERNKETVNEKAREKIVCKVCNCMIARSSRSRHEKLKKHLNNKI